MSGDQVPGGPGGPAAAAIDRVVAELSALPGVAGIVLGGSRARGTAAPDSDVDLGLYYVPRDRPDFDTLLEVAGKLDDRGRPTGGGTYGEWGPWINGGVWLQVGGFKTDILLRDADRVREVLEDCAAGRLEVAYQPGHPHAFVSSIYAGEVFHNVPLHDPDGVLADLRRLTDPYPDALVGATVRQFGWEAGFALGTAGGAADRGDVAYVAGCAFRAVSCLVQVLHAGNRRYLLNEKGGVAAVDRLPVAPPEFAARVGAALAGLAPDPAALRGVVDRLSALHEETDRLIGEPAGAG